LSSLFLVEPFFLAVPPGICHPYSWWSLSCRQFHQESVILILGGAFSGIHTTKLSEERILV
ncbi:MAG: hypothetical protein IKD62_07255, partial [Oscillospiraceae bacterium]|nr:hypothetical protein [Oscillospiraceae bacterium]